MEPFELPNLLTADAVGNRHWLAARLNSEGVWVWHAHRGAEILIFTPVIIVLSLSRKARLLVDEGCPCSERLCQEIRWWLSTSYRLTTRDLKSWHKQKTGGGWFSFFFCFSRQVPGWKLRAGTFSAVSVCLRTCQPSTEWSVLLLQPRGVLRRDLRFTPFAWQFSVKNRRSSTSGASVLPPKKQTTRQKARLGGHQSSSKT